jgi:hypothetical protein
MRAIPLTTKEEIFRNYLEGISTTENAKLCGVSVGIVSSVTKEESHKDNNYLAIRETTRIFRKNNLKISDVISGIRLYNKAKGLGLEIPFLENFLEATDTKSFRIKKDIDEFLEGVIKIIRFEEIFKIKIEKIQGYVFNLIKKHKELIDENKKIKEENAKLHSKYNVDKSEIEEYLNERTLFLQYKKDKWSYQKSSQWFINPILCDEVSKQIGITIDPEILYQNLNCLLLFPHTHKNLLKKIMSINNIFRSKMK